MRPALASLTFLVLLSVLYAAEPCIACSTFANASSANILYEVDQFNKTLSVNLFYENFSSSPSRLPINNTIVIIELTNGTGHKEIYKVYTNDEGKAILDFSAQSDGCLSMKVLYCPFCNPGDPACGFAECLSYAKIHNETAYYDNVPVAIDAADDIPPGTSPIGAPGTLNPNRYFPDLRVAGYCAPPPPLNATPAICLPLLIIFSLLGGALYLTGKNPFLGFNMGGARVGRHIRYQARGRGFSLSAMAVVSAVQSVAGAIKSAGEGKLGEREHKAAMERGAFVSGGIAKATRGIKFASAAAKSSKGKGAGSFSRHMEARIAGAAEKAGGGAQSTGPQVRITTAGVTGGASDVTNVRASEMFGGTGTTGAAYFGNLALNLLVRLPAFLIANTPVVGAIDGFIALGGGRSLFEKIFVNHDARLQADRLTLREAMTTDQGAVRVGLPDGREVPLVGQQPHEDGSLTMTFRAGGDAQTRDGNVSITVDRAGVVSSVSYEMRGAVPDALRTPQNPEGFGVVSMQINTETRRMEVVVRSGGAEVERIVEPAAGDPARQRWSELTTPAFTGVPAGATVGADASGLRDSVRQAVGAVADISRSVDSGKQRELALNGEQGQTELDQNPDMRRHVETTADSEVRGSFERRLGVDSIGVGLLVGDIPAVEGQPRVVTAAIRLGQALETSGLPTMAPDLATRSGVSEEHRDQVTGILGQILTHSGPRQLADMTPDQISTQVRDGLAGQIRAQNPGMTEDRATQQANGIVSGMDFRVIDRGIEQGVTRLDQRLEQQGFNADFRREMAGMDVHSIGQVVESARQIAPGGSIDAMAVLARDRDSMFVTPTMGRLLEERDGLTESLRQSRSVTDALDRGSFGAQDLGRLRMADDIDSRFIATVAIHTTHDQLEGQHVADVADRGVAASSQAALIQGTLTPADPVYVREFAQRETQAREAVATHVAQGDLDTAANFAQGQYRHYVQTGNDEGARAWGQVVDHVTGIQQGALPSTTPMPAIFDSAPSASQLAQREGLVQAETERTQQYGGSIARSVTSGDYGTAASHCADAIDHYRQVGDERTALAYQVALTQIQGLHRGEYFQTPPAEMDADRRTEAFTQANTRILEDIGMRQGIRQQYETGPDGTQTLVSSPAIDARGSPYYPTITGTPDVIAGRTIDRYLDLRDRGTSSFRQVDTVLRSE